MEGSQHQLCTHLHLRTRAQTRMHLSIHTTVDSDLHPGGRPLRETVCVLVCFSSLLYAFKGFSPSGQIVPVTSTSQHTLVDLVCALSTLQTDSVLQLVKEVVKRPQQIKGDEVRCRRGGGEEHPGRSAGGVAASFLLPSREHWCGELSSILRVVRKAVIMR